MIAASRLLKVPWGGEDSVDQQIAVGTSNLSCKYPTSIANEIIATESPILWNRFQLAHGLGPTALRLIVALEIIGGTTYGGALEFA